MKAASEVETKLSNVSSSSNTISISSDDDNPPEFSRTDSSSSVEIKLADLTANSHHLTRTPTLKLFRTFEQQGHVPQISYDELRKITNNFDSTPLRQGGRLLGRGGFGTVFLGQLPPHQIRVAIKVLNIQGEADRIQFKTELLILARYRHENLAHVQGFSIDGPSYCIIYDYMANGSLEDRLACLDDTPPLASSLRKDILVGAARGICYLHQHGQNPIIHRDIKSANVLLDEHFVAKVSDFAVARSGRAGPGTQVVVTRSLAGTSTYMAPEAYRFDVTVKLDTYSFGVVILEVISGLPPIDTDRSEPDLVLYMEDRLWRDEVVDKRAGVWPSQVLAALRRLAEQCLELNRKLRPTITEVLPQLESL